MYKNLVFLSACMLLLTGCPDSDSSGPKCDDCDDGIDCTVDTCDEISGECQNDPDSTRCASGQECNAVLGCLDPPLCQTDAECDDSNICTDDTCEPRTGCVYTNNTVPCDDNNPCTTGDACADGACVPGTNNCQCQTTADCAQHEDGDFCNGTLVCINDFCEIDPATVVTCDPSADTECHSNQCHPPTGDCVMVPAPDGTTCDDNDACTQGDACTAGICFGNPVYCDDGDPCSSDECDPYTGCQYTPVNCDDNNACTLDVCISDGTCIHTPLDCDDSNMCTIDTCDSVAGCQYAPEDCDDNNVCTTDTCDPSSGCINAPSDCDDANACTIDTCDAQLGCQNAPLDCEDNNICTTDSCDPATGCVNAPLDCDDSNACTIDTCDPVAGCQYEFEDCRDGNVCTIDACDPASGCYHPDRVCDDLDVCTTNRCDSRTGCYYDPITCDDQDACTTNHCDAQTGCYYDPYVCDDGDPCTHDVCDGLGGCDFPYDYSALCPPPDVTIDDVAANRGGFLVFPVALSGPAPEELVLDLAAVGVTATPIEDFEDSNFRFSTDDGRTWQDAGGANGTQVTFPYGTEAMLVEVWTANIFGVWPTADETMELSVTGVVSGQAQDISDTGIGTIRPYVCLGPFFLPNPDICDYRGRYLTMSHGDYGCMRYLPLPPEVPWVCQYCDDSGGTAVMRPPDRCDITQEGDWRCRGDVLERCSINAGCGYVWWIVEDCSDRGGTCSVDQCINTACDAHECTERDEQRCNGFAPEICQPDWTTGCMTWNEPTHMCIPHYMYCMEVQGEPTVVYSQTCNFLELGTTRCNMGNIEICLYWEDAAYTCGYRWRPLCVGTGPGDPECPAETCGSQRGELRCNGPVLELCDQDACGIYWSKEPTCPECNGYCELDGFGNAQCVPPACDPASDDYRCVGDILEECVDDAQCGQHWRVADDCRTLMKICDDRSDPPECN